jgi:hypothetical protein
VEEGILGEDPHRRGRRDGQLDNRERLPIRIASCFENFSVLNHVLSASCEYGIAGSLTLGDPREQDRVVGYEAGNLVNVSTSSRGRKQIIGFALSDRKSTAEQLRVIRQPVRKPNKRRHTERILENVLHFFSRHVWVAIFLNGLAKHDGTSAIHLPVPALAHKLILVGNDPQPESTSNTGSHPARLQHLRLFLFRLVVVQKMSFVAPARKAELGKLQRSSCVLAKYGAKVAHPLTGGTGYDKNPHVCVIREVRPHCGQRVTFPFLAGKVGIVLDLLQTDIARLCNRQTNLPNLVRVRHRDAHFWPLCANELANYLSVARAWMEFDLSVRLIAVAIGNESLLHGRPCQPHGRLQVPLRRKPDLRRERSRSTERGPSCGQALRTTRMQELAVVAKHTLASREVPAHLAIGEGKLVARLSISILSGTLRVRKCARSSRAAVPALEKTARGRGALPLLLHRRKIVAARAHGRRPPPVLRPAATAR